jgi:hypothetical protein
LLSEARQFAVRRAIDERGIPLSTLSSLGCNPTAWLRGSLRSARSPGSDDFLACGFGRGIDERSLDCVFGGLGHSIPTHCRPLVHDTSIEQVGLCCRIPLGRGKSAICLCCGRAGRLSHMPQNIQNSHGTAAGFARNSHEYGDKAYRSHILPGLCPAASLRQ